METEMSHQTPTWLCPIAGMRPAIFYLRCLRVVIQVIAAYWFSNQVSPFFYQQF
jgi:hypothetical protein